tara:strand:- start:97 stop:582 length:486 start_codon:yes stop_codon:yes gene_type:complete
MSDTPKLSHLDESGRAEMVDVGAKATTERMATAKGAVYMAPQTLALIAEGGLEKGDVIQIARIAGIMAAKKTSDLIPLCHPLPLTKVSVDIAPSESQAALDVTATAKVAGQTGVEMEALTAVSAACLTIYDMAKAVDKAMRIGDIRLTFKSGGKSVTYEAD